MLRRLAMIAILAILVAGMLWFSPRPPVPERPPLPPYGPTPGSHLAPFTGNEVVDYFERHEAQLRQMMPDYDAKLALYRQMGGLSISQWQRWQLGIEGDR